MARTSGSQVSSKDPVLTFHIKQQLICARLAGFYPHSRPSRSTDEHPQAIRIKSAEEYQVYPGPLPFPTRQGMEYHWAYQETRALGLSTGSTAVYVDTS